MFLAHMDHAHVPIFNNPAVYTAYASLVHKRNATQSHNLPPFLCRSVFDTYFNLVQFHQMVFINATVNITWCF